jgi:hypothetical protein
MPELLNRVPHSTEKRVGNTENPLPSPESRESSPDNWNDKISKAIAARRAGQEARRESPPVLSTSVRAKPRPARHMDLQPGGLTNRLFPLRHLDLCVGVQS